MKNTFQQEPILFCFALLLVCIGCSPTPSPEPNPPITSTTPKKIACDCTIYPFPNGCDSQCGFADGVVESVSNDSVTVKIQAIQGQAAEFKTIPLAPLNVKPAALKPGTPVRLTYEKSTTEPLTIKPNAIRSLVTRSPQQR
jgi:hypothetical protein